MKKTLARISIVALIAASAYINGCQSQKAEPEMMAGQQETHERHATGIDSHVND